MDKNSSTPVDYKSQLAQWRDESLRMILSLALLMCGLVFVLTVYQVYEERVDANYLWRIALVAAAFAGGRALPQRFSDARAIMVLLALYTTGVIGAFGGITSLFGVGFLGFAVVASLFFGLRGVWISLVVIVSHALLVALAFHLHWMAPLSAAGTDPTVFNNWIRALIVLAGMGGGIGLAVNALVSRLRENFAGSVELVRQLEEEKTERQEVEKQLRKSERLDAIGRLAGGIAHDFNNTLTVVVGEADYIASEVGSNHPVGESAEMIRQAVELGTSLTRRLLLIGSGKDFLLPKVVELQASVSNFARIARRVLPETVEIKCETSERVVAEVDEIALHQALLNLAINAGDAMNQSGTLHITCTRNPDGQPNPMEAPGDFIVITVRDEGSGIPSDILTDIFDPFFTTKGSVKTAGLGLATVYGFAKASGGLIEVESELGKGTTFTLWLPSSNKALPSSERILSGISNMGAGRIALVAEDNLRVRAILWTALSDAGFSVLEAGDGDAALALLQASKAPVSVLVTDLMMPGLNGAALAKECSALCPGVKILVVTGYAGSNFMDEIRELPNCALLRKPFGRRELLSSLLDLEN